MWNKASGDSAAAAVVAKSLQSCPTLRDPVVGRPPGSPIPGILQARTLEWVAIYHKTRGEKLTRLQEAESSTHPRLLEWYLWDLRASHYLK